MAWMRLATCPVATFLLAGCLQAQADDPDARPPLTKADAEIAKRAAEILNSPEKWNRADDRVCVADAKTFSLYCALELATDQVSGNFAHRGAAMQEARFVVEEVAPNLRHYDHRLMDYNNDPTTSFADIQGVFWLLEKHVEVQVANGMAAPFSPSGRDARDIPTAMDLESTKRASEILSSPYRWNRADNRDCPLDAKKFSLYCALQMTGSEPIDEARFIVPDVAPNGGHYDHRLMDYNNDPTTSFADIQGVFWLIEKHIEVQIANRQAAAAK